MCSPRRVVGIVAGGVLGGIAAGFSGGKNHGLEDIMLKVLVGAVTGLALRAAPGALSEVVTPRESLGSALQKAVHPDSASPDANVPGMPSSAEVTGPPAPVTSLSDGASRCLAPWANRRCFGSVCCR